MRNVSVAQLLAAAGTVGSLLVVTVAPALQGPVEFSPSVALDWMGLVALLWATAYAADNLLEIRRARFAEFEPLLDVVVEEKAHQGGLRLFVAVRNLGKGAAAGLSVHLWWPDMDQLQWFAHPVTQLPELLAPGERGEELYAGYPYFRFRVEEDPVAHLGVEVQYRDALGRFHRQVLIYGYDRGGGVPEIRRMPGEVPQTDNAKQRALDKEVARLAREIDLAASGRRLTAHVQGGHMAVCMWNGEDQEVLWSRSAEVSIFELLTDVKKGILLRLEEKSEEQEEHSDPD